MEESCISWSQLFTNQNHNNNLTETNPSTDVTESFQKLQINNSPTANNYNQLTDPRTREQILADRKSRKQQVRQQKSIQSYQQKLEKIREPKSDKIQFITADKKEKFDQSSLLLLPKELSIVKRSAKKSSFTAKIEINLLDFVVNRNKKSSTTDKNRKLAKLKSTSTIIKRHKGKKREIPKKKWHSRMKKSILLSRQMRKEQQIINSAVKEPDIVQNPKNSTETQSEKDEIVLSQPSSSPKKEIVMDQIVFSRKFRS